MSQRVVLVACTALLLTAAASLGAAEQCSLEDSALLATNSIRIDQNVTVVSGDVVVNTDAGLDTLVPGFELTFGNKVSTPAGWEVRANRISVGNFATIAGSVFCNLVIDSTGTVSCSPLALPVFPSLPAFKPATPGGEHVSLANKETVTLSPGPYLDITGGVESTIVFEPGTYHLRSLSNNRKGKLLFQGATEIRIAGSMNLGVENSVQAAPGFAVGADEVVFYVGGDASLGGKSSFNANVYSSTGTVTLPSNITAAGAFLGKYVIVGQKSQVTLASSFVNRPPVADPQTIETVGDVPVLITLTGSDPENSDLTFSIEIPPDSNIGSLSPVSPIVPNDGFCSVSRQIVCTAVPGGECPAGETCVLPPVTSATVTYTPVTADNESNSFVFKVADECGKTSTATVEINPDDPGEAPPVEAVTANDLEVEVVVDSSIEITLDAGAPESAAGLTYRIETLPAGTLSDSGGPITMVPHDLSDPTVVYAAPSTPGTTSFTYSARDSSTTLPPCGSPSCDTGVVDITINEAFPLAEDISVETPLNTPVQFTLKANPGGAGSGGGGGGGQVVARSPSAGTTTFYRAQPIGSGEGNGTRARRTTAFGSAGSSGGAATNQGTFDLTFDAGWSPTTAIPPAFFWGGTIPVFADETFTFTGPGCLSVTDDFQKGDQFRVYDNGSPIFTTPAVAVDAGASEVGPQAAYLDPTYSSATFVVGAGSHSITIEVIGSSFSSGRGYIRVDTECKPNLEITSFSAPAGARLDEPIGDEIFATVTNTGFAAIPAGTSSSIGFYTSPDSEITTADRLLVGGRENMVSANQAPNGLAIGEQWQVDLSDGAYIGSETPDPNPPLGDVFIGAVMDEFDAVDEVDEGDNTASADITVQEGPQALTFSIQTLPSFGLLTTQSGAAVSVGQPFSVAPILVYTPNFNSSTPDSFQYQVTEGPVSAVAVVDILVSAFDDCAAQGRPPGCAPGTGGGGGGEAASTSGWRWFEQLITGPTLTVEVAGEGDVATSRRQVLGYDLPGLACSGRCTGRYAEGQEVLLYARPLEADSVFVSWGGDCSGTDAVALVTLDRARHCVAVFESRPMEE